MGALPAGTTVEARAERLLRSACLVKVLCQIQALSPVLGPARCRAAPGAEGVPVPGALLAAAAAWGHKMQLLLVMAAEEKLPSSRVAGQLQTPQLAAFQETLRALPR